MPYQTARLVTVQTIAYTGVSAGIAAKFQPQTRQLRLVASSVCFYKIGDGVQTATITDTMLPANWVDAVSCTPGQFISAIRGVTDGLNSVTSGTLNVTELTE